MNGTEAARYPIAPIVDRDWWRRRRNVAAETVLSGGARPDLSFWALVTFTAILLLAPQQTIMPFLSPLHVAMLSALVAIGAHALDWLRGRAPLVQPGAAVALSVLLLLWAVASVPFSLWPGGSVGTISGVFIKTLIIFWLLGSVVVGMTRLRYLAWTLALISVPLALTALSRFSSGTFIEGASGPGRIIGYDAPLAGNPNDLALLLNIILPLIAGLAAIQERPSRRMLLAAIMVLNVGAIVATFSRAGFISLALSGVLYVWRFRSRLDLRWFAAAALLGVLALPLVPGRYYSRLSTIFDKSSDPTGSAQARWTDMSAAAGYIVRHPVIGAGIGMDILALNDVRGPRWHRVHDVYLEYGMDLGIPGLLLFLLLMAWCFRAVRAVRRGRPQSGVPPDLRWLAEGLAISLATFAVSAIFYPASYEFYFYYLAGLAVGMRATMAEPKTGHRGPATRIGGEAA
jgi:O-antigen ligase